MDTLPTVPRSGRRYPPGVNQRQPVPDAAARRIEKAAARYAAAKTEHDEAHAALVKETVDAMKAGASFREAAAVAGVDERTAHRWGKANGWPTEEQKAAEQAKRDEKDAAMRRLGLDKVDELLRQRESE